MFVPDIPAPAGKTRQVWESMSIEVTRDLVLAAGGRALLLFTSRKQMTTAYDSLADRLPFNTMMQGQKPNKALAAEFMADETSVLFGVSSFMTGVDFQGATCSLVVIDKLMFAVPDDPLVEARCDAIKARGGNDFMEFVVPTMSLTLQQAAGRLIRSKTDTGVVALLDSRVTSKAYGKTVLRSLPPAPLVRSMAAVEDFFAEVG
jgi:ATP-dependent DNA helicase DinG